MAKSKEKPVSFMVRLYKKHRGIIRQQANKRKVTQAEVVRQAIINL